MLKFIDPLDGLINRFSGKLIFIREKKVFFRKLYSYFSFYAREKNVNPLTPSRYFTK